MNVLPRMSRRTFLTASGTASSGLLLGQPSMGATKSDAGSATAPAKSTILLFLCGGASHVDTWDMKPKAPAEYRGPFQPIATSAPGMTLCEHLPMLARQAHHLTLINSVNGRVNTNDHHAGYYHNLTGHVPDQSFRTLGNNRTPFPDDWPFMGSVVAAKRPVHPHLPNAITLPHKPSTAPYTRPGQFAARLGVEHNPIYLQGSLSEPLKFQAPSLQLQKGIDGQRLADRGLLDETLLMITSEMGRKPKIGDPRSGGVNGAGRDHWTHCLTDVLAGGGIRGGQTYGSSDRLAEYPADKPVMPADVTKTVYHAMGIHGLEAFDSQNRPYNLLAEGSPIHELF